MASVTDGLGRLIKTQRESIESAEKVSGGYNRVFIDLLTECADSVRRRYPLYRWPLRREDICLLISSTLGKGKGILDAMQGYIPPDLRLGNFLDIGDFDQMRVIPSLGVTPALHTHCEHTPVPLSGTTADWRYRVLGGKSSRPLILSPKSSYWLLVSIWYGVSTCVSNAKRR